MVVPGILYTSLLIIGMNYFGQTSSFFIESIILKTGLKAFIDSLNSNWLGFFITMGSFWLWFTLLLFYFALFKYLFLMLFSPMLSYLHLRIDAAQKEIPFILAPTLVPNSIASGINGFGFFPLSAIVFMGVKKPLFICKVLSRVCIKRSIVVFSAYFLVKKVFKI